MAIHLHVSRGLGDLVLTKAGQDPTGIANIVPIPVAAEGMTQYSCVLGQEVAAVHVRFFSIPDEEPTRPWYLAWWPF